MATPLTGWDPTQQSTNLTLSNDNYGATVTGPFSSALFYTVKATEAMTKDFGAGLFYWEVAFDGTLDNTDEFFMAGISRSSIGFDTGISLSLFETSNIAKSDGFIFADGSPNGLVYNGGDNISFLLDLNAGTMEIRRNGISSGTILSGVSTSGEWFPIFGSNTPGASGNLRDGTVASIAIANGLDPAFTTYLNEIPATFTSYYFLSVGSINADIICRDDRDGTQLPSILEKVKPPFDASFAEGLSAVSWNPDDADPNIVLSNLDLTASGTESRSVRATSGRSDGKWYWEYKIDSGDDFSLGVGTLDAPLNTFVGADENSWGISSVGSGDIRTNAATFPTGVDFGIGDIINVAIDTGADRVWFGVNNVWIGGGDPATNLNPAFENVTGKLFPMVSRGNNGSWSITARFSETAITQTIPFDFDAYDSTDGPVLPLTQEVFWDETTIIPAAVCDVTWNPSDKSSDVELSDSDLTASTSEAGDTSFNDVELLLHMDGISGGTVFTDDSLNGFTMTRFGSTLPTTETDIVQFGTAAGKFTSSSGERISTTDAVLNLDNGTDFTIEGWAYQETPAGGGAGVFGTGLAAAAGGTWIRVDSNGQVTFFIGSGSFGVDRVETASGAILPNEWHHYAGTYIASSGTLELFIDGVSQGTNTTVRSFTNTTATIGRQYSDNNNGRFRGRIDDVRITKGVNRYPSNFTPPTLAFPNAALPGPTPTPQNVRATQEVLTGKFYWEVKYIGDGVTSSDHARIGIAKTLADLDTVIGGTDSFYVDTNTGQAFSDAATVGSVAELSTNDVVNIAYDKTNADIWFGINGSYLGGGDPSTNTSPTFSSVPAVQWFPWIGSRETDSKWSGTANFGATAFTNTVPTGFVSGVCTAGTIILTNSDLTAEGSGSVEATTVIELIDDRKFYMEMTVDENLDLIGFGLENAFETIVYQSDGAIGDFDVGETVVWNPADADTFVNITSGVIATMDTGGSEATTGHHVRSTKSVTSGKFYWEVTNSLDNGQNLIGISQPSADLGVGPGLDGATGWSIRSNDGLIIVNGGTNAFPGTTSYSNGDVIGIALDMDTGKLWFSKNGTFLGTGSPDPAAGTDSIQDLNGAIPLVTGTIHAAVGQLATVGFNRTTANFGQFTFSGAIPVGFTSFGPVAGPGTLDTYDDGDVIGLAIDSSTGNVWWSKNGTFLLGGDPGAGTSPLANMVKPLSVILFLKDGKTTMDFGGGPIFGIRQLLDFVPFGCGDGGFVPFPVVFFDPTTGTGTLSEFDLRWASTTINTSRQVDTTFSLSEDIYFEIFVNAGSPSSGFQTDGLTYINDQLCNGGCGPTLGEGGIVANDTFTFAFKGSTGQYWYGKNGTFFFGGDPASGTNPTGTFGNGSTFSVILGNETGVKEMDVTANFGNLSFTFTIPTGFTAFDPNSDPFGGISCSSPLPESDIIATGLSTTLSELIFADSICRSDISLQAFVSMDAERESFAFLESTVKLFDIRNQFDIKDSEKDVNLTTTQTSETRDFIILEVPFDDIIAGFDLVEFGQDDGLQIGSGIIFSSVEECKFTGINANDALTLSKIPVGEEKSIPAIPNIGEHNLGVNSWIIDYTFGFPCFQKSIPFVGTTVERRDGDTPSSLFAAGISIKPSADDHQISSIPMTVAKFDLIFGEFTIIFGTSTTCIDVGKSTLQPIIFLDPIFPDIESGRVGGNI